MAKLAVTFALTFFLFTLCYARIPTGIMENDIAGDEQLETTTTSPAVATMVPLEIDSKLPVSDAMESDSNSIPLTMISIRPIDRHFPRNPFPLMFRHGHRCRHHHRHPRHDQQDQVHEFKPWGPRFPNREVPYGDDMIVVDEKDSGSNPESRGVVHQIPGRSIRFKKFGHEGPRFHHVDVEAVREEGSRFHRGDVDVVEEAREKDINEKDSDLDSESRGVMRQIPGRFKFSHEGPRFHHWHDDVEGREHMIMKKMRHHRHGVREEREHERERKHKHEHEHEDEGGFMKRVSKFLDLF